MTERTFGWIQDPGKVKNLRQVVEIFDSHSCTHEQLKSKIIPRLIERQYGRDELIQELNKKRLSLKYRSLVGTAFTPRASAKCNGIIQAVIKGQKRSFIADWPADNFLRWAVSLGFVKWKKVTDSFSITPLGKKLSRSQAGSDEEYQIYRHAFLSYPPIARIINLLVTSANEGRSLTKFELGKNLGFVGEEGFTSISQNLFVKEIAIATAEEKRKIKSNWEGDSDKYARMICSWLMQLKYPWVKTTTEEVTVNFGGRSYTNKLQAYTVTLEGYEIRKMILGKSKFHKVAKVVYFEMLSTKGRDRHYLRVRRAHIIKLLSKEITLQEIKAKLKNQQINETLLTIKSDIKNFENIGLSINKVKNKYVCVDEITELEIPISEANNTQKSDILKLVENCRKNITAIPHEYLVLIPISFDKKQSRMFEIKVIELLTEYCHFEGLHLGVGRKPDGIIYTKKYGVIIDTKSYQNGFHITASERDKMKRYIEENQTRNKQHNPTQWWTCFPQNINQFLFLFISGQFGGHFKKQMKILSEQTNNTLGGALTSYALLNIAEQMAKKNITHVIFKNKISCLDKVFI